MFLKDQGFSYTGSNHVLGGEITPSSWGYDYCLREEKA
jgi:hypothetical protein